MEEKKFREHLQLIDAQVNIKRKKRIFPGYGKPKRDYDKHAQSLKVDMDNTVKSVREKELIDPSLIFKINYKHPIDENFFEKLDLKLLSNINAQGLNDYIMFGNDMQMNIFFEKLNLYKKGISEDKKSAYYDNFFSNIENISPLSAEDRKGKKLKQIEIIPNKSYWVNIELWHIGDKELMREKIRLYRNKISELGGKVTDDCLGNSFCLMRVNCTGSTIKKLLEETSISEIDLIPENIYQINKLLRADVDDLIFENSISEDAPQICIIDSGIMPGHPALKDAITEMKSFGSGFKNAIDENGHGTLVASIALYGDVQKCIENKYFEQNFHLLISRVLDKNNQFPKEKLIENQITESINYFYENFNCKIFNLSIGLEEVYDGGKQFTLAQKIDELIREKDILVCISIGNLCDYPHNQEFGYEKTIKEYPNYLLEEQARLLNPATASLALTVGSISVEPKITNYNERGADTIPVAKLNEPSPFTRTGFGVNNSIKPEVCEYGGNATYSHLTKKIYTSTNGLGIIGCNAKFVEENTLFTVNSGTSFATPKITNLAANLIKKYKTINSNTIRALIANSCDEIKETKDLLEKIRAKKVEFVYKMLNNINFFDKYPKYINLSIGNVDRYKGEIINIEDCPNKIKEILNSIPDRYTYLKFTGYGKPNLIKALNSYNNKVTMYAQDTINIDDFKIYELYIPPELLNESGKKIITITLAFSPPTRHTRKDYLGYDMSYKLIRGLDVNRIIKIFRKKESSNDIEVNTRLGSNEVKLFPGINTLKNSTLKQSYATFTRSDFISNYGNILHLVVFNESKWVDESYGKENFSVVVTIEHLGEEISIDLYDKMKTYIDTRVKNTINKQKVGLKAIKIK